MRSEARARLARMTEERGMDGVLRINTYEGADLPPGSNRFSPCLCPQHRTATPEYGAEKLSVAVREANQRSRGERL
ncbi:hypothetical protein M2163_000052 [Streptomyces sp. SAI-135]|uniref:hypothetical protein n=1 Tax=unclassified Streptomyces TaxID=2593676 RepID=UPI00247582DC|nr:MULTISPECIES: hypothetical protein [unclassified Streptomyces]MDH6523443.1 hypothetical protein [Streptomyces sp. SAI-090]MDH6555062.1 hypothetical protein [Streptomyces sp. SAI-041]MDH6574328.1 hypothetical protein [Streptomyces sp. SAI-117]MDH6580940.1 hypothetical protein [Streptomyces sp. SAI-133]MDH6612944.1 hypothetical protein [Streptomyces sp. SAI-135]